MVIIDKDLCTGCGACAGDCPAQAIHLDGKEQKAEVTKRCLQCGHCVAVCPAAAVSIPEYDMEDVEEYDPETFSVPAEHFLRAVKFRRSIRNFKEQPLEREKLERILEAGRYTATARNLQACTFVLVQDRLEEFKNLVWREAPVIIEEMKKTNPLYARIFRGFYEKWRKDPKEDTFFFNTTSFLVVASENPLDGGLASANMENMAAAEGAGVLYSGYMMRVISASRVLREWLGIGEKPVASCMLLGYPAVTYRRTAPRRKADIIWK